MNFYVIITSSFFFIVLSFTKYINELTITIDGETVFKVKKTQKSIPSSQRTFKEFHTMNTLSTEMFRFNSFVYAEQIYKIAYGPSIILDYIDVELSVNIEKEFHDQIRKIIQKSLPSTIHIKLLFPSRNVSRQKPRVSIFHYLSSDSSNFTISYINR